MPEIGRFFNIDPLADKYTYNSPYAFQENKLGIGRELEGLEVFFSGSALSTSIGLLSESTVSVSTSTVSRGLMLSQTDKVINTASKVSNNSSKFSSETLQHFSRGNRIEAEQLAKNGFEKNTKPIEVLDPKTNRVGKTTPDALKPDGGTVEIKNVKLQSLTRQLRLQKRNI